MLWVNIFLSLRSLGHARHSFSDKTAVFVPLLGALFVFHLLAILRTPSRGQRTTNVWTRSWGSPSNCPAHLELASSRGIIAGVLVVFSGVSVGLTQKHASWRESRSSTNLVFREP